MQLIDNFMQRISPDPIMAGLIVATIPILAIIYILYRIGYTMGYHAASQLAKAETVRHTEMKIREERNKLLAKGEQVGYEKGLEAGTLTANENLRNQFVDFLKDQILQLEAPSRGSS